MLITILEAALVLAAILLGLFPIAAQSYSAKLQSGDLTTITAARILPYLLALGILLGFVICAVAFFRLNKGYDNLGTILTGLFWAELGVMVICTGASVYVLRDK